MTMAREDAGHARTTGGVGLPRATVPLLVILATVLALIQRWSTIAQWQPIDLRVYVAAGRAAAAGQPLYDVVVSNGHDDALRFTYPPFAALTFTSLAALGGSVDVVFTAVSGAAYLIVVMLCAREVRASLRVALVVAALGLALEPVQRTLLFGQINLVLLAVVVADALWVRGRWRGALIGLAASIKLTPLVLIAWFLLRRQYREAATMAGTFIAAVVVGWLFLPGDSARFWLQAITARDRFGPEIRLWGNQSISAVADRATQLRDVPAVIPPLATGVFTLLAAMLAFLAAQRAVRDQNRLRALCAVGLGGLLVAPVSWTHHFVWVLPVLFVLVVAGSWVLASVTAILFFLPPMWLLAGRPDTQLGYSPLELVMSAAWALWAVIVLFQWARPSSEPVVPQHGAARSTVQAGV